jgi:diguanylate cyclase (GGDEF)-like protein
MRTQETTPFGLASVANTEATARHRSYAIAILVSFVAFTVLATVVGATHLPVIKPIWPILATLWCVADLLTAFLLLNQFSVTGLTAYAGIASAYGVSGLLTIPCILYFPLLFSDRFADLPTQQISIWLWVIWHVLFPLAVLFGSILDPGFTNRVVACTTVDRVLSFTVRGIFALAIAISVGLFILRSHLPILVVSGAYQPLFLNVLAPVIVALDFVAAFILLWRAPRQTILNLWLAVALVGTASDAFLNTVAVTRYTFAWYAGKIDTLLASCVVLVLLLGEVIWLYRRLADLASIDALTQLGNRRAADEYLSWTIERMQRHPGSLALLVVDIDDFKRYNDAYGHAAGDLALRAVAQALNGALERVSDTVARYGGEEFVVILPDSTPAVSALMAERMRARVAALAIPHTTARAAPYVTVSIGLAMTTEPVEVLSLFAMADDALYEAKRLGRNRCVVSSSPPVSGVRLRPPTVAS